MGRRNISVIQLLANICQLPTMCQAVCTKQGVMKGNTALGGMLVVGQMVVRKKNNVEHNFRKVL